MLLSEIRLVVWEASELSRGPHGKAWECWWELHTLRDYIETRIRDIVNSRYMEVKA